MTLLFQDKSQYHFLVLISVPLITILYFFYSRRCRRHLPFPPGPRPLPIIGNMRDMHYLTHRGMAKLHEKYGSLCHLRLGSLHVVGITTPEMARQVMRVQDSQFSNRPVTAVTNYLTYDLADMAFAPSGPFWRQMRKLCIVRLFSRKRGESWASVREEINTAIATTIVAATAGRKVDVGKLAFELMTNITFRAAFGSRSTEDQSEFVSIVQEFSKLFGAFGIRDMIPWLRWWDPQGINKRAKLARAALDRFIDGIIDEHLVNPKEVDSVEEIDMVDDMIALLDEEGSSNKGSDGQDNIKLSRDNIKGIIMDVMFGGTETVASAMEWALAELLKNPEELKKVQQELTNIVGLDRKVDENDLDSLPYLKCVVKETLRLHPPIPLLFHESTEDGELAGYFIPVKTRMWVNVWAIGRDKSVWTEPDSFNPSRFYVGGDASKIDFKGNHFDFLPFGSGRRSCPGMQLGLYGLELALAHFLHCFEWELPEGLSPNELDMDDIYGLTAPRAVRLVAVPTLRLNCPL